MSGVMNLAEALANLTPKDLEDIREKIGKVTAELLMLKEVEKLICIKLGIKGVMFTKAHAGIKPIQVSASQNGEFRESKSKGNSIPVAGSDEDESIKGKPKSTAVKDHRQEPIKNIYSSLSESKGKPEDEELDIEDDPMRSVASAKLDKATKDMLDGHRRDAAKKLYKRTPMFLPKLAEACDIPTKIIQEVVNHEWFKRTVEGITLTSLGKQIAEDL